MKKYCAKSSRCCSFLNNGRRAFLMAFLSSYISHVHDYSVMNPLASTTCWRRRRRVAHVFTLYTASRLRRERRQNATGLVLTIGRPIGLIGTISPPLCFFFLTILTVSLWQPRKSMISTEALAAPLRLPSFLFFSFFSIIDYRLSIIKSQVKRRRV